MKGNLFISGIVLSCLVGCSFPSSNTESDFLTIEKEFENPGKEYRPAPLAVWNTKIEEYKVKEQIYDLSKGGFGGLFVHPRPGLVTEYLSEDWFKQYEAAVEECDSSDMNLWIYDENSYPTGFAGGHVPALIPSSYNQGQGLYPTICNVLPSDVKDYFIVLKQDKDGWTDITSDVDTYAGKSGNYYLYKKTFYPQNEWFGGYSYVDLLYPGVTEKFIDVTLKPYKERFKDKFGQTIKGVFSDEPHISVNEGFRWTPDLFKVFYDKWKYDLRLCLPSLHEKVGNWKQVRHNYMEVLLEMFIERWSKPYSRFCAENNLIWTGHYWEHGWPLFHDGPDNMAMYAWHQMPGIDMLFNQFDEKNPITQFGNIRAVKELRSVANQMGHKRTLCEIYGGGGWDETFKDFKRLGDWTLVLGVNFMNPHLSHMTLQGARKYDYPPTFSYHSPWWNDYKYMNDYFTRLSFLTSNGVQDNDILILEPTTTLWSYFCHIGSENKLMLIGRTFQEFITSLEKQQVEYDLGSENIIKNHGSINNKKMVVGKADYSLVVIPPLMENINSETFNLLKKFAMDGGKILCFSKLDKLDGKNNDEVVDFFQSELIIKADSLSTSLIENELQNKSCVFSYQGGNLFHQRRVYKDGELLLLVNASMTECVKGSVDILGKSVALLDAFTGKILPYNEKTYIDEDKLKINFNIEPAGSLVLYVFKEKNSSFINNAERDSLTIKGLVEPDSAFKQSFLEDNALTLDFCELSIGEKKYGIKNVLEASDIVYKKHGFKNGNPWNTSIQYKDNIIKRDTFTNGGFSTVYSFSVEENFDYSNIKLVCENPQVFEVYVNEQPVQNNENEWWLDRSFGVFYIGQLINQGTNKVRLSVSPMSIYSEIEPIYIVGDFSLSPQTMGWGIKAPTGLKLGSWKEQGYPFYSWGGSYSNTYSINDLSKQYFVELGKWAGTVAEVYVNSQKAGIIFSEPYELNISSFLMSGKNTIEVRIIGSLKNLLGPHYVKTEGIAAPWHWQNCKVPVSGSKYDLKDYGLMEYYQVVSR